MDSRLSVEFKGKIVPIKPLNSNLTLAKCFIMALGKNRNRTNFSKESVEDAMPTLFNIPVVGRLFLGEDGAWHMGGHDKALELNEDGTYKLKAITVPFGVVPVQDNVHYEEVKENDGTINTYLVADIILWTGQYPTLLEAAYNEETLFNQSMEVDFLELKKRKDGYTDVNKFQFSKLCMLGKSDDEEYNRKPCFPSARVDTYEFSEEETWTRLSKEFSEELAKVFNNQENENKGESMLTSEVIEKVLAEFGIESQATLDFEINKMTEDEVRAKLSEQFSANGAPATEGNGVSEGDANAEPSAEHGEDSTSEPSSTAEPAQEPEKFELDLTNNQKREALCDAAAKLCNWSKEEYTNYWLCDFTDEYVYLSYHYESRENKEYGHVRCTYKVEGEMAVIEVESAVKVKLAWVTAEDEAAIEANKKEFEELKGYKAERIEADRRKEYGEVIGQFSDLSENEEYKAIVGRAMEFASVEDLEKEFFALRGRLGVCTPKKKAVGDIRIPTTFEAEKQTLADKERQFMQKYLRKNNN